MKKTLRLLVAVAAIIGFAFAGCQGPTGPQGIDGPPGGEQSGGGEEEQERSAPELEIRMDEEQTEFAMFVGDSRTLVPTVYPEDATVQTLLWELYDDASGEIIALTRAATKRFPMLSGNSVVVTGLADGEATLLVTAMGSGDELVQKIVTVTVEGLARRIAALPDEPDGDVVLAVYADERLSPTDLSFGGESVNIDIVSGAPEGVNVTVQLDRPGSMFTVGRNVTLTLKGVTLRGITGNTGGALIVVEGGGALVVGDGSEVVGNFNTTTDLDTQGGGVRVASGGELTLAGGEISGNGAVIEGGGVFNRGVFTMTGGAVSGNATTTVLPTSGGGGVGGEGDFTMSGGVISGNTVTASGGWGGGVFIFGAFSMSGDAEISGNIAGQGGGVLSYAIFTMHGGTIRGNVSRQMGGGLDNWGVFVMHGGDIFGNEAAGLAGGGVFNRNNFLMHGGRILGNTAPNGAGIENMGDFQMGGGIIYGIDAGETGNAAGESFAVLRTTGADAESRHGAFVGNVFQSAGALPNTDLTLRVEDGELQVPDRRGDLTAQLAWLRTFAPNDYSVVIDISGDETIAPTTAYTGANQMLPTGRTMTIVIRGAGGETRTIRPSGNGNLFRIPNGVTLILENIRLEGIDQSGVNANHLVRVANGGVFIMNAGSAVTGNRNYSGTAANGGGGVRVNHGGRFVLNGGEISGNSTTNIGVPGVGNGAGVRVEANGRFYMLDGTIFGNNASQNGGGVFVAAEVGLSPLPGNFYISGGTIYGNEAEEARRNTSGGFGASLNSAGIVQHGAFTGDFDGATVASLGDFNESGSLFITNATIKVAEGALPDRPPDPPSFDTLAEHLEWLAMFAQDGDVHEIELAGNEYLSPVQAALPVGRSNVTIVIVGSAQSELRLSQNGVLFTVNPGITLVLGENITLVGRREGGNGDEDNNRPLIRINGGGTLIMNAGSKVTGNVNVHHVTGTGASNHGGGGVLVETGGTFVLNGGEISDNATTNNGTALSSAGFGGGVRIETGGRFYMHGGAIFGNNASYGGGVRNMGTFRMSGGIIYGLDDDTEGLRNVGRRGNVSFRNDAGATAEFGTLAFDGTASSLGTFSRRGTLSSSSLNVNVIDGDWQVPVQRGSFIAQLAWMRYYAEDGGDHVIEISEDVTLNPDQVPYGLTPRLPIGRANLTITLRGVGGMRTIALPQGGGSVTSIAPGLTLGTNVGSLFRIPDGITLVLDNNVTLLGRCANAATGPNNTSNLVRVEDGGTLIMNTGSLITGNTQTGTTGGSGGGGVRVNDGGTFVLNGGEISGNGTRGSNIEAHGGGVRVGAGGRFYMRAGRVSGNVTHHAIGQGGGVWVAAGGIFRISDGTIADNASGDGFSASLQNMGTSEFGAFVGDGFTRGGDLGTNNNAMIVTGGIFDIPSQPTAGTFLEQLAWVRAFAQRGSDHEIILNSDEDIAPMLLSAGQGFTLALRGNGTERRIGLSANGTMFEIGDGLTLVLGDNVTLQGRPANNSHLVRVIEGGILRMDAGSRISGNVNTATGAMALGGGVRVNAGGVLELDGGTISSNSAAGTVAGGGVHLAVGGTLNMTSGYVSNNVATGASSAGGVLVVGGTTPAVFNMRGGTVSGNRATIGTGQTAGGVRVGGAAPGVGATFNMRGGTIAGNSSLSTAGNASGGVTVLAGSFLRMSDGVIYGAGSENPNTGNAPAANRFGALFRATAADGARYGTFDNGVFTPGSDIGNRDDTVRVVDGVLQ